MEELISARVANMAKAVFVIKSIIFFLISEKTLSLLILLGMVVCDTIFLVFGNVFWSDARSNEYDIYKNNVVTFEFDSLDIDRFLEMTESRDYVTSAFFSCTELDGECLPVTISAYSPPFDAAGKRIRIGHGLTGAGAECVVSDRYLQRQGPVLSGGVAGKEFRFLGTDWTCTGMIAPSMADNFDFLVNMADFIVRIKNQENKITAGFRYENGASLMEIRQFADLIKEEFHADFASVPSGTVGVGFGKFLSDMSEMLVLLVTAIINYMFLYRFLLRKRMYAYGIFKLQGMDNCLVLAGLCAELLLFLAAAFSLSLLLYLGGTALFGQMGTVLRHGSEFLFSFIIIGAINLFFFGLAAVKLVRSSPVELIRESVVG